MGEAIFEGGVEGEAIVAHADAGGSWRVAERLRGARALSYVVEPFLEIVVVHVHLTAEDELIVRMGGEGRCDATHTRLRIRYGGLARAALRDGKQRTGESRESTAESSQIQERTRKDRKKE